MKIIFSNSHFVAIDKPAGVLSVPSRFSDNEENKDQRVVAGRNLQEQLGLKLYPIHRLDFEVSGILLFAKSAKAQSLGSQWLEQKKIQKTYSALSESNPDPEKTPAFGEIQKWESQLLRGKKRSYISPHGKPSLTLAKALSVQDGQILWELQPVTGRSHQLRFELSRHGFPILGDELYGSQKPWRKNGIALRAYRLEFPADDPHTSELELPKEILISARPDDSPQWDES